MGDESGEWLSSTKGCDLHARRRGCVFGGASPKPPFRKWPPTHALLRICWIIPPPAMSSRLDLILGSTLVIAVLLACANASPVFRLDATEADSTAAWVQ